MLTNAIGVRLVSECQTTAALQRKPLSAQCAPQRAPIKHEAGPVRSTRLTASALHLEIIVYCVVSKAFFKHFAQNEVEYTVICILIEYRT